VTQKLLVAFSGRFVVEESVGSGALGVDSGLRLLCNYKKILFGIAKKIHCFFISFK